MRRKQVIRIALVTGVVLSVPVVAMQVSDRIAWGPEDFAVAAVLLFGAGMTYAFIAARSGHVHYRAGIGLAVAAGFMLIVSNLAVGIIGSEDNPANLMYFGVLAIGLVGAAVARFRPLGMVRAVVVTAIAQVLATAIGLVIWLPEETATSSIVPVVGANAFFVLLFLGSAALLRSAGADEESVELDDVDLHATIRPVAIEDDPPSVG